MQGAIVLYGQQVAIIHEGLDDDAEVKLRYVGKRSPGVGKVRAALLVEASDKKQRDAVTPLFPKVID
eukprot:COSAG01_NODE_5050_length_4524_cov_189.554802_6_plen_67_part_00